MERSAWWLLQSDSQSACPACGCDLSKAIESQRVALWQDGYDANARRPARANPQSAPETGVSAAS
ncbi:hypothetical protein [Salinisphaera sp. LB1]|uniref:hypothetical protein n=1 Tax=Salinisphaera sp. LB1 TaxID=2183911 RepID=UPI000D7E1083|nr:hypothetical protein [Salinisphaera sp. LB1]AWN15715.1 hypothetical protein SALB1_1517 [Salinisphaera sp. LB1]